MPTSRLENQSTGYGLEWGANQVPRGTGVPPVSLSARSKPILRPFGWFRLLILLFCGSGSALWGQAAPLRDTQIKAVFLFNFARFVEWPAGAFADDTAPVVVGVLGDDPFGSYLDEAVRNETANGRPIIVQRFRRVADVENCHILFISKSEDAPLPTILARLKGRTILTVSDADNFAERGGMIGFVTTNNKVRLKINVEATKNAALIVSAKLLRPAEIIGPASGVNGTFLRRFEDSEWASGGCHSRTGWFAYRVFLGLPAHAQSQTVD
jgi:hypothetical protein